jgi:thiosulfate dehydrogenase (quinone) large subunit
MLTRDPDYHGGDMSTSLHDSPRSIPTPHQGGTTATTGESGWTASRWSRYVAAAIRLSLGWVFLWAFLDKTFALGHETGVNPQTGATDYFGPAAWIHGGSPTQGFLGNAVKGPLADFYSNLAGNAFVDWIFMIGLLGIGAALVLGIGMRIAAASGVAMLVLMWSAVLPPANNPFMDDHLVYALVLVLLALIGAGRTVGLGAAWERLGIVQRHPILK